MAFVFFQTTIVSRKLFVNLLERVYFSFERAEIGTILTDSIVNNLLLLGIFSFHALDLDIERLNFGTMLAILCLNHAFMVALQLIL
jgi:hypothetical protein